MASNQLFKYFSDFCEAYASDKYLMVSVPIHFQIYSNLTNIITIIMSSYSVNEISKCLYNTYGRCFDKY